MRICYIILTCEKYIHTRREWQLQTMFKNFPKEDIYYLGHTMDPNNRIFSWGAYDTYDHLPYKFLLFFTHIKLDYDWYVFIDDDTYVFHDRLESMLQHKSCHASICIGKQLIHLMNQPWGYYMSGGAGTVLSRNLYMQLHAFMNEIPNPMGLIFHWCADICLGLWVRLICNVEYINHLNFHCENHKIDESLQHSLSSAITFHHLREKEEYMFYHSL